MKKTIILPFLGLLISQMVCADNVKTTSFKAEKATVYLSGAQLFCDQQFNLAQGINEIVFQDVSPFLDQRSIQASGKGNFIITDVFYRVKEAQNNKTTITNSKFYKEIKQANDSLEELLFVIEDLNNKQNELVLEKNLLLNNRIIKGDTKKDSLNLLKESMDYLRSRYNNINSELLKINKEQNKLSKQQNQLNERIRTLEDLRNQVGEESETGNKKAVYEIVVMVLAEAIGTANISISFYTSNAAWYPAYDLRAENDSKKIKLFQKAVVTQNTGIDWKETKLTFSTSTPSYNTIVPVLYTHYLYYYQQNQMLKKNQEMLMSQPAAATRTTDSMTGSTVNDKDESIAAEYSSNYTQASETMINMEYEVKIPYSVKNDGKNHFIMIQEKELDTDFMFRMVPKLDNHAYLQAKIVGWENLNLISGNSRIYFNGSFVGESYLDMNQEQDTLEINLGRDDSWVIKREQIKDKTKEKILSDKKVKTVSFDITIRNTKEFSSDVVVEDQIPVSNQKDITVKLVDGSNGDWDELTGKLTWKLKMKPKETKTIKLVYEIHYPSDRILASNN